MSKKLLTIGCAVYDDYDGVFFTIQSLRMYHSICNSSKVEFVVLDNNPKSSSGQETKKFVQNSIKQKYIPLDTPCTSFAKYKVPDYADGKYILILDSHVMLEPNGISNLLNYFEQNPETNNIIQGPLWYDDLNAYSTHLEPVFRGNMYGTWATDKLNYNKGLPFEIQMQGMGLCAFRKETWKGINPYFRGFGAEEGYIQAKFKQWGGNTICLPSLKWNHRFGRPLGIPYKPILEDRIFNYFLGWLEIYQDINHPFIKEIYNYFITTIDSKMVDVLLLEAEARIFNKPLFKLTVIS